MAPSPLHVSMSAQLKSLHLPPLPAPTQPRCRPLAARAVLRDGPHVLPTMPPRLQLPQFLMMTMTQLVTRLKT
jgi:hypothetical protein